MSRRIGEEEVIRLLRRAGRDVELNVSWIVDAIDGSTQTGPSRVAPSSAGPSRAARPGRDRESLRRYRPRRLLAVPLAAVLAGGVFVTVHAAVATDPGQVRVEEGASELPTTTASPPDSTLGDAKSITVAPVAPDAGSTLKSVSRNAAIGATLTVSPVISETSYRMPLRNGGEWVLTSSVSEKDQRSVPAGEPAIGPAQSLGSGQAVSASPFVLSWGASGESQRWLTSPGEARGVPAALRVPVRVKQAAGTITLLAGTVGGGGTVKVEVPGKKDKSEVLSQRLPDCPGDIPCPAIVTIKLDTKHAAARGNEVMIELSASRASDKVGLAAVELD